MFEQLSDKVLGSIKKLRGKGQISETNIEEVLKDIRLSLLEADVNFKVVKNFLDRVKTKALGSEVLTSLEPSQQFVKIVHDELVTTLGGETVFVDVKDKFNTLLIVGLQGNGKTTTSAKLALYIRQKLGKKPGLVSVDVYRPAAAEQLQILAKQNGIPYFEPDPQSRPLERLRQAQDWAQKNQIEALIVDTAGRLQIDESLMQELQELKDLARPSEILLVADAMLGQQSVSVAEGFHKRLSLTGLILTKVDGDARGGAALSFREVTGLPIKFLGVGEKVAALEVFHPDRLAKRILDMGDVLSLVEKAQEVVDEKQARDSVRKMAKNEFTFEDFLGQIQQLKKMGGFESVLKFLPGMGEVSKQLKNMTPPDDEIKKIEAIIRSMTPKERKDPRILNASRRQRIAKGSGTEVQDINKLVRQFEQAQKMMSQVMKMGMGGLKGARGRSGFPF
ncbi:MAG: signal recognition particle protein [Bdellovibrionales bacterium]